MSWTVSLPNSFVEVLPTAPPNSTVFRDGVFNEGTELKRGHWHDPTPVWRVSSCEASGTQVTRRATMWGHDRKVVICKPQKEPNPLAPWSWTSILQNHETINLYFFSTPAWGVLLWQPQYRHTQAWRQEGGKSYATLTPNVRKLMWLD